MQACIGSCRRENMCMHVSMYVCMHASLYRIMRTKKSLIYAHFSLHTFHYIMYVCMYVCRLVCMYVCTLGAQLTSGQSINACMYVCMHASLYVCMCVHRVPNPHLAKLSMRACERTFCLMYIEYIRNLNIYVLWIRKLNICEICIEHPCVYMYVFISVCMYAWV